MHNVEKWQNIPQKSWGVTYLKNLGVSILIDNFWKDFGTKDYDFFSNLYTIFQLKELLVLTFL